jgi:hypothetical protein
MGFSQREVRTLLRRQHIMQTSVMLHDAWVCLTLLELWQADECGRWLCRAGSGRFGWRSSGIRRSPASPGLTSHRVIHV